MHGWPEPVLRLNGNWLEATGALPVPGNLGTPGAPNSTHVDQCRPGHLQCHAFRLRCRPPISQPWSRARCMILDGVQSLNLYYRIDPSTNLRMPCR